MESQRGASLSPTTIHFYTFSDEKSGSSRQRAFRVAEEFRARGLSSVIHAPPVLLISRTPWPKKLGLIKEIIRSLRSIKKDDIIYLQRTIANKYFFLIMVAYLLLFRRKMVFDIDDPVYLHSFFKTKTFVQLADLVIVTSHTQAEWAKKYNANVHLFHITVKLAEYEKFTKDYSAPADPCVIGWIGSGPEQRYNLEILARVFRKLVAQKTPPFKFILVGALGNKGIYQLFESIPGLSVEFIDSLDWASRESIPREIQKFDIGVVPNRIEGEWNKGKQSYKAIEYMACGVATIASAFGEMPYVIRDGVEGCLAATEEEWTEKLTALLGDRNLQRRLGHSAQERIRNEYAFEVVIPRMMELIQALSRSKG